MDILWRAIEEENPGPKWARLFEQYWPAYRRWWLREGAETRPPYLKCRKALQHHMPELVPLYDELCELAGGGDHAARFLSFYCPPAYLSGCSQAIWPGAQPVLVRNYDYSAQAFDSLILRTGWQGRKVLGTSDGLWGLVDGINDAGLAVSLTFGGRQVVGNGFGVPLILRYVLQTCASTEEAGEVLARIPTHMSYNVTVIDAKRRVMTAMMAPDRETLLTNATVATNHQETVEWVSHARFTATVERERFLLQRLTLHRDPLDKFINAFLKPPLYSTAYDQGFGTLYTAVYKPRARALEIRWPRTVWAFSIHEFFEGQRIVRLPSSRSGSPSSLEKAPEEGDKLPSPALLQEEGHGVKTADAIAGGGGQHPAAEVPRSVADEFVKPNGTAEPTASSDQDDGGNIGAAGLRAE